MEQQTGTITLTNREKGDEEEETTSSEEETTSTEKEKTPPNNKKKSKSGDWRYYTNPDMDYHWSAA